MKAKLKQSVHLQGHDYKLGTHEMPDSVALDPYFLALVANGLAIVTEPPLKSAGLNGRGPKAEAPIPADDTLPESEASDEEEPDMDFLDEESSEGEEEEGDAGADFPEEEESEPSAPKKKKVKKSKKKK